MNLKITPKSKKLKKIAEKAAKIGLMIQKVDIAIYSIEKVAQLQEEHKSVLGTTIGVYSEKAKVLQLMQALSGYAVVTYMWCFTQGKGYRIDPEAFFKYMRAERRSDLKRFHGDIKDLRNQDLAHYEGVQSTTKIHYFINSKKDFSYQLKPSMLIAPAVPMFVELLEELKRFLESRFEQTNNLVHKEFNSSKREEHFSLLPL